MSQEKFIDIKSLQYILKELRPYYGIHYRVFLSHDGLTPEMVAYCPTKWPQEPQYGEIMTVYTPKQDVILTQDFIYTGNTTGFKLQEDEKRPAEIQKWFEGPNKAWIPVREHIGIW